MGWRHHSSVWFYLSNRIDFRTRAGNGPGTIVRSNIGNLSISFVVTGPVTGLFGSLELQLILVEHGLLNEVAASLIDGVSDIRVKLARIPFFVANFLTLSQANATVIAEGSPQVIFVTAAMTASRQFSAGHSHKRSGRTFYNFEISNNETMVDRNGAKSSKAILRIFHQLNANLGNLHCYHSFARCIRQSL
jgi:hypothetical protein